MLITFTGRKSKRIYTTPVRYVRDGPTVRCFTSAENQWWRNLRGGAVVCLRIEGSDRRHTAVPIANQPEHVRAHLERFLTQFPQDACYYDIALGPDKRLNANDLDRASHNTVMVEAHRM